MIEIQGKKYWRVTEVLAKYQDTTWFTEESRERGTAVHRWCASYAQGLWCQVDRLYQGYCDSFARWFDLMVDEVVQTEQRLTSDLFQLSGQYDLLATSRGDNTLILSDIKTSVLPGKTWPLQLGAYNFLIRNQTEYCPSRYLCVMPDKNGRIAKSKDYSFFDILQGQNLFLGIYNAHKYIYGEVSQ